LADALVAASAAAATATTAAIAGIEEWVDTGYLLTGWIIPSGRWSSGRAAWFRLTTQNGCERPDDE